MNSSQPIPGKIRVDQRIRLERCQSWEESFHVFDEESALAVEIAAAAGRPLLVRGEPGSGKSQLARAAAQELNRFFVAEVISSGSEGQDLLWHYDPVARFGDAQILAAEVASARAFGEDDHMDDEEEQPSGEEEEPVASATSADSSGRRKIARYKKKKSIRQRREHLFKVLRSGVSVNGLSSLLKKTANAPLHPSCYVSPGLLWWAIDCTSAWRQHERCRFSFHQPWLDLGSPEEMAAAARRGSVVLIDEIDKADPSLPNALLEVLGNGGFHVPLLGQSVTVQPGCDRPLVIITTNEERELPAAFVRRCFVLVLRIDDERRLRAWWSRQAAKNSAGCRQEQFTPERALVKWLAERGEVHFERVFAAKVREKAAELLVRDRKEAKLSGMVGPGQAEYLDLLRAVRGMAGEGSEQQQLAMLDRISPYALVKHPRE